MKKATTLDRDQIKQYFPNHRICLVKVLLLLINGILLANSCNLNKIKKKGSILLGEVTNVNNLYIRFIRFFKMKSIDSFVLGVLHLALSMALPYIGQSTYHCISIDRTNWKIGRVNINILYIGLVLGNGYFIPLYFRLLDKKGNSSQAERLELFDQFRSIFNTFTDFTFVVVGDREFIGQDWFYYLVNNSYEFVMRIRCKDYVKLLAAQLNTSVERLNKKIDRQVKKNGYCIRFISTSIDPKWVSEQYGRRWKIEVFFEDNKSKGFDLEAIGFTQAPKIRLMVAICAVCYLLCLIQGIIAYQIRPARTKIDKATGKVYKRTSVFTKGYERMEQLATQLTVLIELINRLITPEYSINYEAIHAKMYIPVCQK